ncbi:MAG: hypothetical protein P8P56_07125 [Yoonia sp.]|nr:hypothetical protein [Yoonia sp.]
MGSPLPPKEHRLTKAIAKSPVTQSLANDNLSAGAVMSCAAQEPTLSSFKIKNHDDFCMILPAKATPSADPAAIHRKVSFPFMVV